MCPQVIKQPTRSKSQAWTSLSFSWNQAYTMGVVSGTCDPGLWVTRAGGCQIWGQPGLHNDILSPNKTKIHPHPLTLLYVCAGRSSKTNYLDLMFMGTEIHSWTLPSSEHSHLDMKCKPVPWKKFSGSPCPLHEMMDVTLTLDLKMTWRKKKTFVLLLLGWRGWSRHVASPIWQKPFYITPTAKCEHVNPQLASGVDEERWGKIKPREDVTQKMAQELTEREDFDFPNPSGYHLHHNMCKWLPLEFSSTTQPAKSQPVSLSRLAWLASYSGSHSFDRLN